MKKTLTTLAVLLLTTTIATSVTAADYLTTSDTAPTGKDNTLTFYYETTFNLVGNSLSVGDYLPSVTLMTNQNQPYDTTEKTDKVRIFSVLASIDTPVCNQQAQDLSDFVKANLALTSNIEFIGLSADTTFALDRFKKEKGITDKVTLLSDAKDHVFGFESGTQISELGLLARSTFVVDKNNKIVHIQRVPELTMIPDLNKAVEVAKEYF
ncbi:redoxin family protein [Vibrio splendidus]|uniref:redoxin family protein n=1 Tax=Vibrio splendidus TaxID=29497 RepID=UPI00246943FB|nr:redoxin family protein [Vibrio splendidus]MDH5901828.1 redoxin family protein [Vibrio splendidus]